MADIPKRRGLSEAWYTDRGWEIDSQLGSVAYSPQYSDDEYVYRLDLLSIRLVPIPIRLFCGHLLQHLHITVSRKALKRAKELLHQHHAVYKRSDGAGYRSGSHVYPLTSKDGSSLLPYDDIVQRLHVHMSNDWILYLIHDRDLTLCFRRPRRDKS
eukprot:Protomagalhaensia_sp_Gyna_25__3036@NODE_279_length_4065_cov_305_284401_g214_i0_p3_GENE_NODE_279_length_4065_cov_305_284401_g214_i0NODE_279_length_4065_cov_305_284401_g214_i0_p3_ORF_typecomplete_len156_score10_14CKS/PF01111_19/2_1e07BRCA2/PF00634_18/0_12_NODE_279_length_4065_cov_305_284401_g214_i030813548